jgi:hypothetical protein
MFRPAIKNTTEEEIVFCINGDNYRDIIPVEHSWTESEAKLSKALNDSLMGVLWESINIFELEKHLKSNVVEIVDVIEFRVELPYKDDGPSWRDNRNSIFGWVHYKEGRIKTFRFEIELDGTFKKC